METIIEFLKNNHFASGGLLIGLGAVLYRHGLTLLYWIYSAISRYILVTIEIDSQNSKGYVHLFWWVRQILEKENKPIYDVSLPIVSRFDYKWNEEQTDVVPRTGRWYVKTDIGRCFVSLGRSKMEGKGDSNSNTEYSTIRISTFVWNKKKLYDMLINTISSKRGSASRGLFSSVDSHYGGPSDIKYLGPTPYANENTVILREGLLESICSDITKFIGERKRYNELGITYKRVYLLYGPPGTGKTSLIKYLASHFSYSMVCVNPSQMAGPLVRDHLENHGSEAIIYSEDIDRESVLQKDEDDLGGKISVKLDSVKDLLVPNLSTILNRLDGIATPEGFILFMTCNNIDKLDSAFVRPGRIDRIIKVDNADQSQARRIFLKFFPSKEKEAVYFSESIEPGKYSMAKLQQYLMCCDTVDEAIKNIDKVDDLSKDYVMSKVE